MPIDIFNYEKPDDFLKDYWIVKRKNNSRMSIRAWALQLGIKHHNTLHEMMTGKRKVTKSLIPVFIRNLQLGTQESLYFEIMVDKQRAKSIEEKNLHMEKMRAMNFRPVRFMELESFRYLEDPLHYFIGELVLQKDFDPNPDWIKSRLGFKVTTYEIKEAIERLIVLGILKKDADGKLHRSTPFIQSKSDVADSALKEFHKRIMGLASLAVSEQDLLHREFQAMSMNIDPSRMREMKDEIRRFVREFTAKFDTPRAPGEELYQLNLQFFSVSKNLNKEDR